MEEDNKDSRLREKNRKRVGDKYRGEVLVRECVRERYGGNIYLLLDGSVLGVHL